MEITLILLPTFLLISVLIWIVIACKWKKCKNFFHKSYSYMDLLFIFSYFIEQILLTIFLEKSPFNPQIVVGIFSIVVMTTVTVQNKAWESRTNKINEKSIEQNNLIFSITKQNKKVIKDNKKLGKKLKEAKNFINKLFLELKRSRDIIEKLEKKR